MKTPLFRRLNKNLIAKMLCSGGFKFYFLCFTFYFERMVLNMSVEIQKFHFCLCVCVGGPGAGGRKWRIGWGSAVYFSSRGLKGFSYPFTP
jgi:hypothetical protein